MAALPRPPERAGARGDGVGVAAGAVPRRRGRPPAAAVPQEQARLLPPPRDRAPLQPGVPAPGHDGLLGQDPHRARRHGRAPGGGVGVVGGLRRRLHRHGLLPPARQVRRPQPGRLRLAPQVLRAEVVARAQRRRLPHPELPVVARLHGRVGEHGPGLPGGARAVGEDVQGGARRQGLRRGGRPVGARVPAAQRLGEAGEEDLRRDGVLLPGLLEGGRRPPRRRRRAVRGRRAAGVHAGGDGDGAPAAARGAGAPAVRGGAERGRERRRPGPGGRRGGGVAAAAHHALRGMPAMQRRPEPDVLEGELRQRDAPRAGVRRRPGAPRVRVPPRRPAQRHRAGAAVRLPRRARPQALNAKFTIPSLAA